jgi:hypothetical protein
VVKLEVEMAWTKKSKELRDVMKEVAATAGRRQKRSLEEQLRQLQMQVQEYLLHLRRRRRQCSKPPLPRSPVPA